MVCPEDNKRKCTASWLEQYISGYTWHYAALLHLSQLSDEEGYAKMTSFNETKSTCRAIKLMIYC